MEVQIGKVLVQAPVERLSQKTGLVRQAQGNLGCQAHQISKPQHVGPLRAMTIILRQLWLGIVFMTFTIRGVRGKAYLSISSHMFRRIQSQGFLAWDWRHKQG